MTINNKSERNYRGKCLGWPVTSYSGDSGLYYHSHVVKLYKDCLFTSMTHRAYQLSSSPTAFSAECNKLRSTFLSLDYPINLINSAINKFLHNINNIDVAKNTRDDSSAIMVPVPFKDQQSANSVKKQMQILSANIGVQINPLTPGTFYKKSVIGHFGDF